MNSKSNNSHISKKRLIVAGLLLGIISLCGAVPHQSIANHQKAVASNFDFTKNKVLSDRVNSNFNGNIKKLLA